MPWLALRWGHLCGDGLAGREDDEGMSDGGDARPTLAKRALIKLKPRESFVPSFLLMHHPPIASLASHTFW